MPTLFANVHMLFMNDYMPLEDLDFEKNVRYLKQEIADRLEFNPDRLEIVFRGNPLNDDVILGKEVGHEAVVHCFEKTPKFEPHMPSPKIADEENIRNVRDLFHMIAHTQISVNVRVNIMQKLLAEYPDFRRNLGAHAIIRDSVLFNTLHQEEVVRKIAQHYPLICSAAAFIVDTVKKELVRSAQTIGSYEPATDSTNSSEEENSMGGSSATADRNTAAPGSSEGAQIRQISRQQLQAALAQIGVGSVNSLSNIAQRNNDSGASGSSVPLSNSASGEFISSELFRSQLSRALSALGQPGTSGASTSGGGGGQMDTSEAPATAGENTMNLHEASDDGNGDIPSYYRNHQYAEQLRTMAQMGFINYEDNLMYLNLTNGNIENAVNLLMGAMN